MAKKTIIILVVVTAICIAFIYAFKFFVPIRYEKEIEENCRNFGVDESLVYAVIKAESGFNENARSEKNAKGLMQLTENTAMWCAEKMGLENFSADKIYLPEYNIKIGVWYLSYLREKTGSDDLCIIAYNAGINRVMEWKEQGLIDSSIGEENSIPYPETKRYLKKVNFYRKLYKYRINLL